MARLIRVGSPVEPIKAKRVTTIRPPRFRIRVRAEVRDKNGRLIQGAIGYVNDVYAGFKTAVLEATQEGKINCARQMMILDSGAGYNQTEIASLKAAVTGDNFTKVAVFVNSTSTAYTINSVTLLDYLKIQYCIYTFGPALSYPAGGSITIEYTVTFVDDHVAAGYEASIDAVWITELATGFGDDADTYTMACGGAHGGSIKIYYTQGATPYDMTESCYYLSKSDPSDATDGYYLYQSDVFSHATHNAATVTKIELIPGTPGGGITLMCEDTDLSGTPSPIDFTAGYAHQFLIYVGE